MTRLSVLVPVFDAAEVIGQAVDCVLRQTAPPDEIVLADDGSRDGLAERVEALRPRCVQRGVALRHARFETNHGRGAARNLALRSAAGELVAWFDADDLWEPEKLAIQLQAFARLQREHPANRLLLTCNYFRYAGPETKLVLAPPTLTIDDVVSVHARRHVQLQTVLGPRAAFLTFGGFDEALNRAEDFDFALRFAASGGKFVNPEPYGPALVHYFRSPANASAEAETANRRAVKKSRAIFLANHVDPEAFLTAKLAVMLRRRAPADDAEPDPARGAPAGGAEGPITISDQAVALATGAEGVFRAYSRDLRELRGGALPGGVGRPVGLAHGEIVDLFLRGARHLEIAATYRGVEAVARLALWRAPSGLICVGRSQSGDNRDRAVPA